MNSPTYKSRRDVFRRIARRSHVEWPVYDATPLYKRSPLDGLESDIRTVSQTWFKHDRHESVEKFVCALPLACFTFDAYDCYAGPTRYGLDTLFRVLVLKELHGWVHETVQNAARTILIKAQNAGAAVPCDPERRLPFHGDEEDELDPDNRTVLDEAAPITDHVSRVVFPMFSLDRGDGCEIHENAY